MKRLMTTAIVALFASSSIAPALDAPVGDVAVRAELGGAADSNILAYYPNIESDIESAIVQRLAGQLADDGYSVIVRLREIGLSGSKAGTGIKEFNRISGFVSVYDTERSPHDSVKLTVNAETGSAELPPNTVGVSWPDGEDFYAAMISAFADEAVRLIDEM